MLRSDDDDDAHDFLPTPGTFRGRMRRASADCQFDCHADAATPPTPTPTNYQVIKARLSDGAPLFDMMDPHFAAVDLLVETLIQYIYLFVDLSTKPLFKFFAPHLSYLCLFTEMRLQRHLADRFKVFADSSYHCNTFENVRGDMNIGSGSTTRAEFLAHSE